VQLGASQIGGSTDTAPELRCFLLLLASMCAYATRLRPSLRVKQKKKRRAPKVCTTKGSGHRQQRGNDPLLCRPRTTTRPPLGSVSVAEEHTAPWGMLATVSIPELVAPSTSYTLPHQLCAP
jgi:hypothetical protein